MKLLEQLSCIYEENGSELAEAINRLLENPSAEIHLSPDACILAFPVRSSASDIALGDFGRQWANADAWYVVAAIGDPSRFFDWAPYPLPLVGWERFDGRPRFYPVERVRRYFQHETHGQIIRTSTTAPASSEAACAEIAEAGSHSGA